MGIVVEFNPDVALRNIKEFKQGTRREEECIPEFLEVGGIYRFLKEGQRNYWLQGELALCETEGGGRLSRPLASIEIVEATHFLENGKPFTKGKFRVKAIFDRNDTVIHFEWMKRIR